MPAEFDPYYTWLGIPPEEQPPHHYRLLGIRPLEADRDVITHAMDQRMSHLKTLQSGKYSGHSQRLLNEVSAAAVVLLDAAQKDAYDAELARQLAPPSPPKTAAAPPVPPPVADVLEPPVVASQPGLAISRPVVIAAAGIAATVLVLAAVIFAVRAWNNPVEIADRAHDAQHPVPQILERSAAQQPEANPILPGDPENTASEMVKGAFPSDQANPPAVDSSASEPMPPAVRSAPAAPVQSTEKSPSAEPAEPLPMPLPTPDPLPEAASEPNQELPRLPTAEQIEAARAKVIEIYGEEGRQAVRPEQKLALARRISEVAGETNNDLAVRYALLDAARKLYAAAGEAEPALKAAAQMAEEFDEDGWELPLATSSMMSEVPMPGEKRDALAAALVTLVDQAVAEEEFAAAEEFARLAIKVGNRSSDANIRRSVVQKRSELTRLKDFWQAVEQARTRLEADPADPAANLVVGKFLCFVAADFDHGAEHLLKSGREPFAAAAKSDLAAVPGATEAAIAAGDAWYALAESVKTSDKELVPRALLRSRHWYERGVGSLSGLEKARVEKRLQETTAIAATAPVPRPEPTKGKGKKGKTKRKGKGASALAQAGPGLIGRGTADGRDAGLVMTYQRGHRLSPEEVAELEGALGPGARQVELVGIVSLSADAEVAIHHVGGSASGGVHYLYLDGKQIHAVGDDRTKDETITLPLAKGAHAIRWQLTGGSLGSALLEFSVARSAAKQPPSLEVFYTQQLETAARAPGARLELSFGP